MSLCDQGQTRERHKQHLFLSFPAVSCDLAPLENRHQRDRSGRVPERVIMPADPVVGWIMPQFCSPRAAILAILHSTPDGSTTAATRPQS